MHLVDENTNTNQESELLTSDKVVALYKFILDLSKLKQKTVLNIDEYSWSQSVRSIHDDPKNIEISYRDRVEEEIFDSNSALLRVHKAEFQAGPKPDEILSDWLYKGWESFRNEVNVRESIEHKSDDVDVVFPNRAECEEIDLFDEQNTDSERTNVVIEKFEDSEQRIEALKKWLDIRGKWVSEQKTIDRTRKLFTKLYQLHVDLERESETLEMVVTSGNLRDRENWDINHPVLTRRVKTRFDDINNTMIIEDTAVETELYSMLFQLMKDINVESITSIRDELRKNDYHPMDRNDMPEFLERIIRQLSPESVFCDDGEPNYWYRSNRILLYTNPSFIIRKRVDGTQKAVEKIIETIQETGEYPSHLGDIVNGGKIEIQNDDHEETIEERLAAVGGESVDILLSKEANKEQLEIAKRIEHYNAVLVQGPPGTGKTHTIANLMGHFLAQGKSVLVTSHTKKALTVLKEKVAPGLQNLCVSVLDDTNEDMERSVDGITEYMSDFNSSKLKSLMDSSVLERKQVITDLAETRKKLFAIINQECNCIVLNGEELSPSKAAEFVVDHADELSYIPGKVRLYSPIPITFKELSDLYRSNEGISPDDEPELACDLPSPKELISPSNFEKIWNELIDTKEHVNSIGHRKGWNIQYDSVNGHVFFETEFGTFTVDNPAKEDIDALGEYIDSFDSIEKWMRFAAIDGKKGSSYKQKWLTLIDQVQNTCRCEELLVTKKFGKEVKIAEGMAAEEIFPILEKLKSHFIAKGKLSKLDLMLNHSFQNVLDVVTINDKRLQSEDDCDVVLHIFELAKMREQCAIYWDNLLSEKGVLQFKELDCDEPEQIAKNSIPVIQRYLDWYEKEYPILLQRLGNANIPAKVILSENPLDSELDAIDRILSSVNITIPNIIDSVNGIFQIQKNESIINESESQLRIGKRVASGVCISMANALCTGSTKEYGEAYKKLEALFAKYDLRQKREEILKKIAPIAPQWANAIRDRVGIHGEFTMPSTIEDAWKWKQYSGIIAEITAEPFEALQSKSLRLNKEYREVTGRYAENSAWYHLLLRTEHDIDMKQALHGWKLTVKKIGKGTGKNAPKYKAKARELMAKCQTAVPAWIMPINKALESLDPQNNKFDIIIVDEASQSDITSLAISYMAKKLIIVGDDKQVSPMAVGVEIDKMNALEQMHIKDIIPNSHLYNAKTSLYDIAATTFQPLMLREHFRCVPEIIGFSNSLSYDFKIKPLRDASDSELLPAVVNYRVDGGERVGKENRNEAYMIVALLKACMSQPEYMGKTFGVISLLGDEQAKLMQKYIFENIDAKEIEHRKILCGNASHFQGDERDVVFLSIVDSNDKAGPLALQGFGSEDAYRKRYNVATSRARDQLWVVDSLDSANDLKPGDLRKRLIDYSLNPVAFENMSTEIDKKADSPFESAVAKYLSSRGFHLVQQWKVGSYRLDMVVVCGKKTVAIECDGERYHSGEEKIREDMERQTILERLGWRFIRIRGSEFYRDSEKTMQRVLSDLNDYGIKPEDQLKKLDESRTTELIERIKTIAYEILQDMGVAEKNEVDLNTIEVALGSREAEINEISRAPRTGIDCIIPSGNQSEENMQAEKKSNEKPFVLQNSSKVVPAVPMGNLVETSREDEKVENFITVAEAVDIHQQMTFDLFEAQEAQYDMNTQNSSDGGSTLVMALENAGLVYIDNIVSSGIIWILYTKDIKDNVEVMLKEYDYTYCLEKRGAIATENKPAWRVMIK